MDIKDRETDMDVENHVEEMQEKKTKSKGREILSWILYLAVVLMIVFAVRKFIFNSILISKKLQEHLALFKIVSGTRRTRVWRNYTSLHCIFAALETFPTPFINCKKSFHRNGFPRFLPLPSRKERAGKPCLIEKKGLSLRRGIVGFRIVRQEN